MNRILNTFYAITVVFQNLNEKIRFGRKNIDSFIHILRRVPDFRKKGRVVYKLENILAMCFIISMRQEFSSFLNASLYIECNQDEFIKLGLLKKGKCPSHDTLMRIFSNLDANSFRDVFLDRIKDFMNEIIKRNEDAKGKKHLIAGDGKTFNGSGRANKFRNTNVMNIYDISCGLTLSSVPLNDKESEIKELQRMLPKFNLSNAVITADALHCQKKTAETIVKHKGEYVLAVKNNQMELRKEMESCFEKQKFDVDEFDYNDRHFAIMKIKGSYVGCDWAGQKSYVRMISKKGSKTKEEKTFYFISSSDSSQLIAESIDRRWEIEGELHYFKDTFLKEDECIFTNKNAIKVSWRPLIT